MMRMLIFWVELKVESAKKKKMFPVYKKENLLLWRSSYEIFVGLTDCIKQYIIIINITQLVKHKSRK